MTQEDYCSYEVAKLLKEKGFDYQGFDYIDFEGEVIKQDRPTHQKAMKWLREVHSIAIEPMLLSKGWFCQIERILDNFCKEYIAETNNYNKYEEAVESALKYCLENFI